MTYHLIHALGNLGGDPEMHYAPSGTAICSFSLATNHSYTRGDGEKVKETTWFRISAFGKQAEACATSLAKGSKVLIVGRLRADPSGSPRIFTKGDGSPAANFEITADRVVFIGSAASDDGPHYEQEVAF